jgi:hypothetical protein
MGNPKLRFTMSAELTLTTPALLFPAISLLLLAYTNRFLTLANLTRELYARHQANPQPKIRGQLKNLSYRMRLIRAMQFAGISSFFCCVLCMFLIFYGQEAVARLVFGVSLILLLVSLGTSMREIQVSIDALNLQIQDMDEIADTP